MGFFMAFIDGEGKFIWDYYLLLELIYIYTHIIHIYIWIINHLQSCMHIEGKHTKMFEVHLTWGYNL